MYTTHPYYSKQISIDYSGILEPVILFFKMIEDDEESDTKFMIYYILELN